MWRFITTTVPVIVRDVGLIKKGTDNLINEIADSHNLYKIQAMFGVSSWCNG